MISLPITSITAIAAGTLILLLTINVVRLRRRDRVVLGDNGDRTLTKAIRGHANAAEQFPIALILMGLAELQGAGTSILAVIAAILILGRSLHAIYFGLTGLHWRFRFYGMMLTLWAQIGLLVTLAITILR